jgi:16S rRNA (uracil1498-N3)-methyltransferase
MHRFYLPPEQCQGAELILDDHEAHHAFDVLRIRPRDRAMVLDGAGRQIECETVDCSRQCVQLRVMEIRVFPPPRCPVTLIQAVTKGKSMEWIIQKATELGAARIVPLLAERTVPHLEDKTHDKLAKWQAIAREALKQSGNPWLPRIDPPVSLNAWLVRQEPFDLALLAGLVPKAQVPRAVFADFFKQQGRPPASLCVWIGPEGDFTPAEQERILAAHAQPVALGPHVLRSETAALCCLSIVACELHAQSLSKKS